MTKSLWTLTLLWLGALVLGGCGSLPVEDDPPEKDAIRYQVVVMASAMLGRPYHYGGVSPEQGFDCSGLVHYSYAQAGVQVPRTTMEIFRVSRPVRLSSLRPGDVLFFKLNSKWVSHMGIYLGDNRFIHAPKTGSDVSITSLDNTYWRDRLISAGRII